MVITNRSLHNIEKNQVISSFILKDTLKLEDMGLFIGTWSLSPAALKTVIRLRTAYYPFMCWIMNGRMCSFMAFM